VFIWEETKGYDMDVTPRAITIEDILALERFDGIFTPAVDLSLCKSQLAAVVIRGCADRDHTAIPFLVGMDLGRLHLIDLESGAICFVPEPSGAGLSCPLWSPDGRHIAVVVASVEGVKVGIVDAQSLEVRLYSEHHLQIDPQRQPPFQWVDATTLVCQLLSTGQRPPGLDITCHIRETAPREWARALDNRQSTASPLRIDESVGKVTGDLTLIALHPTALAAQAPRADQQGTFEAFAHRPSAGKTNQAVFEQWYAAERVLWQTPGIIVESRRSNQGTELHIRQGDQPRRCLLTLNSHLQDVQTGEVMDLEYLLPDDRQSSARCILPPTYRRGERRPEVMFVYPRLNRSMVSDTHRWVEGLSIVGNAHLFAAQGYVVLEPNLPFDAAQDGEVIDSLAKGVNAALEAADQAGLIIRDRVQVFGQSAGGWAVMALLATTDVFCSGIALAGISDPASYDTQPDVRTRYHATQPHALHGARIGPTALGINKMPWEAPQRYLHNSPLYRVKAIQAPLLLMHGDLDYVHIGQSEAMFMALKAEGKTAEFVRYWGEDHVYESAGNIRDAFERIIDWLDRHAQ
jgi:pimeloyl-ACP methyl ester carboxylesterase